MSLVPSNHWPLVPGQISDSQWFAADESFENTFVRIQTKWVDVFRVEISWRFKRACQNEFITLWGYRKDSGFAPDIWSKTSNGIQIVHSHRDGLVREHFNPGTELFYTFLLTTTVNSKERYIQESLRFKLNTASVPDPQHEIVKAIEIKRLERQLEELSNVLTGPQMRQKQIVEILETLNISSKAQLCLTLERQKRIQEIKSNPEFRRLPKLQREELLSRINDLFNLAAGEI